MQQHVANTLQNSSFPEAIAPGATAALGVLAHQPVRGDGCEGGREAASWSAEGAGLVPFKTSPHENISAPGSIVVSFDQLTMNEARIKRLRHNVWLSAYLQNMQKPGHRGDQPWFITLTYVGVDDWRPDHMSKATERYRRWCLRMGVPCRYTWVAELQQRGAVHYHLMVWLPRGVHMPMWDKQTKHRGRYCKPFWTHGMANRQRAKQGIAYLMKYLSKMGKYHQFPRGCRTHSTGGLDEHGKLIRSWSTLPYWVKCLYGVGDLVRVGGKLHELETGNRLEALYKREFVRDKGKVVGLLLTPLRAVPEAFHDGPYSRLPTLVTDYPPVVTTP